MDGSVSTLAPLFAAAFATHNTWSTFLVGLAAAIGAGISMAFAEALSDDGSLTGRGAPVVRGIVCGGMTALGGLGHALPYIRRLLKPMTKNLSRYCYASPSAVARPTRKPCELGVLPPSRPFFRPHLHQYPGAAGERK
jgi:hypothetical protein